MVKYDDADPGLGCEWHTHRVADAEPGDLAGPEIHSTIEPVQ